MQRWCVRRRAHYAAREHCALVQGSRLRPSSAAAGARRGTRLSTRPLTAPALLLQVAVDTLAAAAAAECVSEPPCAGGQSKPGRRQLLAGCTLYVTCEPCIMCAGALAQLGLARAVFGYARTHEQ